MCTVTVIPWQGGLRLAINRDESTARAPASPPECVESGSGVRAVRPVDTLSGGTWVAANDAGVVLALLNANSCRPAPTAGGGMSRGLVIPALMGLGDTEKVIERLTSMDLAPFAGFRLVAADAGSVVDAAWDGSRVEAARRPLAPVCFASSGLGDERVLPRVELFSSMLASRGPTPAMQDEFHRHRWPAWPEISVMMERPGARTLSITVVESVGGEVEMAYSDGVIDRRVRLARPAGPACAPRGFASCGRRPC